MRTGTGLVRPRVPASAALILACLSGINARAHDIPNQRVDRSIQATVRPGRLEIDYEVSLTELTLTQDLRRLIGSSSDGDREAWLRRYGEVTGPLNARGLLVESSGLEVTMTCGHFDLVVEDHPRYTFHLAAELPRDGRLVVTDTNYASSEGTSRFAIRATGGAAVEGDELAPDVKDLPARPVWLLDDEQERRTKRVAVNIRFPNEPPPRSPAPTDLPGPDARSTRAGGGEGPRARGVGRRLTELLDAAASSSMLGLLAMAVALGAIHAVQPGHGKTIVTAVAIGPGASWSQPALLGLITTAAHTGSVLAIAGVLWWTGASQVAGLHRSLAQASGFVIAAAGLFRLGRSIGGRSDHEDREPTAAPTRPSWVGLIGLGLAGGLVPCWDAVGLVVLAAALGRMGLGVLLVLAFSIGMAAVLVAVGLGAARLRSSLVVSRRAERWGAAMEGVSGLILAAIGLWLFLE